MPQTYVNSINGLSILATRSYSDEGGRSLKEFLDGIPANATSEPGQQANPAEMTTAEVESLLNSLT